jgi:hypothetical protein
MYFDSYCYGYNLHIYRKILIHYAKKYYILCKILFNVIYIKSHKKI